MEFLFSFVEFVSDVGGAVVVVVIVAGEKVGEEEEFHHHEENEKLEQDESPESFAYCHAPETVVIKHHHLSECVYNWVEYGFYA